MADLKKRLLLSKKNVDQGIAQLTGQSLPSSTPSTPAKSQQQLSSSSSTALASSKVSTTPKLENKANKVSATPAPAAPRFSGAPASKPAETTAVTLSTSQAESKQSVQNNTPKDQKTGKTKQPVLKQNSRARQKASTTSPPTINTNEATANSTQASKQSKNSSGAEQKINSANSVSAASSSSNKKQKRRKNSGNAATSISSPSVESKNQTNSTITSTPEPQKQPQQKKPKTDSENKNENPTSVFSETGGDTEKTKKRTHTQLRNRRKKIKKLASGKPEHTDTKSTSESSSEGTSQTPAGESAEKKDGSAKKKKRRPKTKKTKTKETPDSATSSSIEQSQANSKSLTPSKNKNKSNKNNTQRVSASTIASDAKSDWAAKASAMQEQLGGAQFRWINEKLYSCSSGDAYVMMSQDPELFDAYHKGYRAQVKKWPVNPNDQIIKLIKAEPTWVVGDFGCGEGKLAESVSNKVYSFDLVSTKPHIIACNIAKVPLDDGLLNVAVFSLSLMGTDYVSFLLEAHRTLKSGGKLIIAEVQSRFETSSVEAFTSAVETIGFTRDNVDQTNPYFVFFTFSKTAVQPKSGKVEAVPLKACQYKKR